MHYLVGQILLSLMIERTNNIHYSVPFIRLFSPIVYHNYILFNIPLTFILLHIYILTIFINLSLYRTYYYILRTHKT